MSINVGEKMPPGQLGVMTAEGPAMIPASDLFAGKKVVLFGLPGAFTPTCSKGHLPGFLSHATALKAKGADTIACIAVNDVFVMDAWGRDQGVGQDILMLADGNGDYYRAIGLEIDSSAFNMGIRGRRFAAVIDDGVVTHLAVDEPGKFEVSKADAVLEII